MYNSYFGFSETPFAITPDPGFLYMSPRHSEALAHLEYGLYEANGFVLLTGEIGTGKTALCRYLLDHLPDDIGVALILNPRQTALELVANICDELHISYPAGTSSVKSLIDLLNKTLLANHTLGRRTVLIIDEAQNLSDEVLEQVRLLTNLETAKHKLLQILLIGQPELNDTLARPELRQLSQRITARYHMAPLSRAETAAYIQHRVSVAGVERPLFSKGALNRIYALSHGTPRLINIICDRALLGAYAQTRPVVSAQLVALAAQEVLPHRRRSQLVANRQLALASLLLVLAVATYPLHPWRGGSLVADAKPPSADEQPAPRVPVPTAVPVVEARPVVERDAVAESFDQLLESPDCDSQATFAALLGRWGADYQPQPGRTACEIATGAGLQCLHGKGTWNNLRRYNRPTLLEMRDKHGNWHQLLLNQMTADEVSLRCGESEVRLPIAEADRNWLGEYLLLWKPPGNRSQLTLGNRGQDVAVLQEQLARVNKDNEAEPIAVNSVFDQVLRRQVMAFQREHDLVSDGIAGKETLILLNSLGGDSTVPTLEQTERAGGE